MIDDERKTRTQLIEELDELRQRLAHSEVRIANRSIRLQQRLREAVWSMKSSDDLQQVLIALKESLRELGLPFQDCGVNLVAPQADATVVSINSLGREGEWKKPTEASWGEDQVFRFWKDRRPVYRRDLDAEDVYGEREGYNEVFGHPVRSVVDVPFAYGTLAVNSERPDAFSEQNIADLQQLAVVLEEAFRRRMDFQYLEERNRELEAAIANRKQAEEGLQEKERLLGAYYQIGQIILSSMDLDEILIALAEQIVTAGIFRSLAISLVDQEGRVVEEKISVFKPVDGPMRRNEGPFSRYALDDLDILAEAARTGRLQIATGGDERFTLEPGIKREEFYRGHVAYFIPVKREERVLAVLATGSLTVEKEDILRRIDGMAPLLDQIAIALEHAGLYEKARQEVASRRQAEEALRESEMHLRTITDNIPGLVAHVGADLKYRFVNKGFERWFGMKCEELVGKPVRELLDDDAFAQSLPYLQQALEGREIRFDDRVKLPDNSTRYFANHLVPNLLPDGKVEGYFVLVSDITERKQLENELQRTARLSAVGELSAGVSHNLNNLLTGVLIPAQLLRQMSRDPEALELIDTILTAGQRARDLAHRLHLSVRGIPEDTLTAVPIDAVVQEAVQATRPRWKDESEARNIAIAVVVECGPVPAIKATRSRLHDLFVNLLFNAVDAMPEGGTITIRAARRGEFVKLTFSDTGTGMDEQIKNRIFEPFFTTKMKVGTGLGLSTVYNTVTQWGGRIDVDSAPGQGTTFTVLFPVWEEAPQKPADPPAAFAARQGKLLIVDDDQGIREILARLLGEDHEVATSADGQEALARFAADRYDVLLIDLGMSGMSGDRLARQIRRLDRSVSLVLITGWEMWPDDPRQEDFDFILQKPFNHLDEIRQVIAQAIELRNRRLRQPGAEAGN